VYSFDRIYSHQEDEKYRGEMSSAIVFTGIMVTLVSLGAIFWVGAQCWQTFVLAQMKPANQAQETLQQQMTQRFNTLSLPLLLVLTFAHIGVLLGQAVFLVGGQWNDLSAALFSGLLSNSLGVTWTIEEVVLILIILLALSSLLLKARAAHTNDLLSRLYLLAGFALLAAIALAEQAVNTKADINTLIYTTLMDWLHLLALALWAGGFFYFALISFPLLIQSSPQEELSATVALLPRFANLAIRGALLFLTTSLLITVIYQGPWISPLATPSGRLLILEAVSVLLLLGMSAFALLLLLPRQIAAYDRYTDATAHLADDESANDERQHLQLQAQTLLRRNQLLSATLRSAALAAVGLLICMSFFTTLTYPTRPAPLPVVPVKQFSTTAQTTDKQFTLKLIITPDSIGPNTFTVHILDSHGAPDSAVRVSIVTTMLDMDMGSDTLALQANGPGQFSAAGSLDMSGHWSIRIIVHTPDNVLHEATITFTAS
jgi:copper transport protein